MATLLEVTKGVLHEQDEKFTSDPETFESWVQENLGVDEPQVREAVLDSDAGEAPDGEQIGPVIDLSPQAAFLAGLIVGVRRDQWND